MRSFPRFHPTPATVLSALALFFALGGSAFAVGDRVLGTSAATRAQPRCATGAVRGIAVVTGDPAKGIANVPGDWTSDTRVFNRRFNCTGRAVQVRRTGTGVFEVRFVGNSAPSAVVNPLGPDAGPTSLDVTAPGVFRITIRGSQAFENKAPPVDLGFVIVAV